jgi:hypothetical protein
MSPDFVPVGAHAPGLKLPQTLPVRTERLIEQ